MTRKNNFDFLRILFASFVIIEHSASLSALHFPWQFPINLAKLGVYGFFIISGYLVTGSFERSGNQKIFLLKRILRIFPGLILMATIVTGVIGFMLYADNGNYFTSGQTLLHYFSTITLIPSPYKCLPGVFQNNPAGCAVNGSLWTLRYEILFYIVLSGLYIIKTSTRKWTILAIFILAICTLLSWLTFWSYFSPQVNYHIGRLFNLGVYFSYGAILYLFPKLKNKTNFRIALILFVLLIFLHSYRLENIFLPLVYPIIVIYFGSSFTSYLKIPKKFGDVSYGMYIYAYPIQQAIIQIYSPSNLLTFTIVAFLISTIFGFVSWHLVEKRCLLISKR